jgi:hypothetical protein
MKRRPTRRDLLIVAERLRDKVGDYVRDNPARGAREDGRTVDKDRINWLLRAVARKDAEAMRLVIQCLSTPDDPKNLHPLCCVGRLEARLSDSDRALLASSADVVPSAGAEIRAFQAAHNMLGAGGTPIIAIAGAKTKRAVHMHEAKHGGQSGERRILTAIAQHPDGVTREQLTVLTGYKRSSRDTYLQRLRAQALVAETDRIRVTAQGLTWLGPNFKRAR